MYDVLIIDGNNLYEKSNYIYKDMNVEINGKQFIVGGIYGFIKFINKLEDKFLNNNGIVYILFDNTNSKISNRKNIDPEYKGNRIRKSSSFIKSLNMLQYLLLNYKDNFFIIYKTNYEADDLVKSLIDHLDKNKSILLISEDQDWARLIEYQNRNIHWYAKNMTFNKENYFDKYGYYPTIDSITLYKVIRGDESDNIPIGIKYIKEEVLLRLLEEFNDIEKIIDHIYEIDYLSDDIKREFIKQYPRLKLNYELIKFRKIDFKELENNIFSSKFNHDVLRIIYKELKFPQEFDKRVDLVAENVLLEKNPNNFFQIAKLKR